MNLKHHGIVFGGMVVLLFWASIISAEILGDFLSYNACMDCHSDIVASWSKTAHARAFETLEKQGEEKKTNPGCVKCHVVGFDADGGFIDMELTPELKGVQCECCHGPGAEHIETEDPEKIVAKPAEAVCRVCHTVGQDKNFDYEKKSRLVHLVE